jgi:hypothetical protein
MNLREKTNHLVSISSEIIEDSYNEGEMAGTGCGLQNQKIGRTFDSVQKALKWLTDNYSGLTEDLVDYDTECENVLRTSAQVADHSNSQNGGWMEPTAKEIALWKKGKGKLFVEHFDVIFITKEDLK